MSNGVVLDALTLLNLPELQGFYETGIVQNGKVATVMRLRQLSEEEILIHLPASWRFDLLSLGAASGATALRTRRSIQLLPKLFPFREHTWTKALVDAAARTAALLEWDGRSGGSSAILSYAALAAHLALHLMTSDPVLGELAYRSGVGWIEWITRPAGYCPPRGGTWAAQEGEDERDRRRRPRAALL